MCWNGQASTALAIFGFASTAYVARQGEDRNLWIPLGYFSLMEALQAATYTVIDQCGLPLNQVLTLFGSLHIALQPFFINAFAMHFVPSDVGKRISIGVYGTCFVGLVMLLTMLYPFGWAGTCSIGHVPFCSEHICSVSGNWHIAWGAPLNDIRWLYLGYFVPVFALPILYGSWKFTLYHLIVGPLLARVLTDNINEWPAVWCLLSIGMFSVAIKTPLREMLYCKRWVFWGKHSHVSEPDQLVSNSQQQVPETASTK